MNHNRLPRGEVLLMLTPADSPKRFATERVARLFHAQGCHGTVFTEEWLTPIGDQ